MKIVWSKFIYQKLRFQVKICQNFGFLVKKYCKLINLINNTDNDNVFPDFFAFCILQYCIFISLLNEINNTDHNNN